MTEELATIPRKTLNIKQQRFVLEYLKDQNGAGAARRAGYSERSCRSVSCNLLKRPEIAEAIREKLEALMNGLDITVDRVLKERARLAFLDPRKFFDQDGNLIPVHKLDTDTAAALAGMDVDYTTERSKDPDDPLSITTTAKIKFADKNSSLTAIEKYLGMYADEEGKGSPLNIVINLG